MDSNVRNLFLKHVAQTSEEPLGLQIESAEGVYMIDDENKSYLDFISGISVSNLGHRHPRIIEAVKKQLDSYSYLMVYGEFIQKPQVALADLLTQQLPTNLSSVYFVNSGSEANEGALKLAKRFTAREEIIGFKNAYHGSTHGCLSVIGNEEQQKGYGPLLPKVKHLEFNKIEDLNEITGHTACVIIEPIQGEAGVVEADFCFLKALREKCNETGALLIFDEIQTGFGRTGKLFAFEHYGIVPDILTLAKAMGGGFPIGAFIASNEIMNVLTHDPVLGHITTFGGHAVSCTAALAHLNILLEQKELIESVDSKAKLLVDIIQHPIIKQKRNKGFLMAIEFENFEINHAVIKQCIKNGLLTDWFLFNPQSLRIAPPLIINEEEILKGATIIQKSIEEVCSVNK